MSRLLLFGGVGGNFPNLSCELLFRHKPLPGPVALIVQNGEIADYCKGITDTWNEYADVRILSLTDAHRAEFAVDAVKAASVIAIGPGKTMAYREVLLGSPLGNFIIQKVGSGTPYAGISAGAILAGELLARDTASGVAIFPALGLLKGVCIEPHYDASREASLQYQMKQTGMNRGLGVGNAMCAEIADGGLCAVHGEGLCVYKNTASGGGAAEMSHSPGSCFPL